MKFFLVLFLVNAFAERSLPKTEPFDAKWQKFYKQMIQSSECAYIIAPDQRHAHLPKMKRMAYSCNGTKKIVYQCTGPLFCNNDVMKFFIRRATCWSKDGKTCPTANACARSTEFDTARTTNEMGFKMLEGSKVNDSNSIK